jgi:hypothetical protein
MIRTLRAPGISALIALNRTPTAAAASSRQQQQIQQQWWSSHRHQEFARKQTEEMARRSREQHHRLDSGEPRPSVATAVGIFVALLVILIGIVVFYNAIGG